MLKRVKRYFSPCNLPFHFTLFFVCYNENQNHNLSNFILKSPASAAEPGKTAQNDDKSPGSSVGLSAGLLN